MAKAVKIIDLKESQEAMIRRMLAKAVVFVTPSIPGSLKNDLEQQVIDFSHGRLYLDPYWAVYAHDGRPAQVRPKGKGPFIWFPNRAEDPRLVGGRTPNRAKDLRHLKIRAKGGDFTRSEFFQKIAQGEIIVTRRVGPTKPQPFFSNDAGGGMEGFLDMMRPELKQRALGLVRSELARGSISVVVGTVQQEKLELRFG
jgi:hypothetical protein